MKYNNWNGDEFEMFAMVQCYTCTQDFHYSHIRVSFYRLDDEGGKMFWSNPLQEFKITCQMDDGNKKPYAWKFEIQETNLETFEENGKIFKSVKKYLDNYQDENGNIVSFAEYVFVILKALSIKGFVTSKDETFTSETKEVKSYITRMLDRKMENWNNW